MRPTPVEVEIGLRVMIGIRMGVEVWAGLVVVRVQFGV